MYNEFVIFSLLESADPQPLGMQSGRILSSQISASYVFPHANYHPDKARLNWESNKCWFSFGGNTWWQVSFPRFVKVVQIQTQGRYGGGTYQNWVESYYISYGNDGINFYKYAQRGSTKVKPSDRLTGVCTHLPTCLPTYLPTPTYLHLPTYTYLPTPTYLPLYKTRMFFVLFLQIFMGNSDRDTVVTRNIDPAIVARHIRVHPVTWRQYIALNLEFIGFYLGYAGKHCQWSCSSDVGQSDFECAS